MQKVKKIAEDNGIEITTIWVGYQVLLYGISFMNPATLGLVPLAFRDRRLEVLKKGSDFAKSSWC